MKCIDPVEPDLPPIPDTVLELEPFPGLKVRKKS